MASWHLAPCLVTLRHEVDRRFPNRGKASDGTIGDASHAARKSDHNPDANGTVHAWDCTTANTIQGRRIGRVVRKACIGDPRVWYVIWRGNIYSKTYGWKKRKYAGASSHYDHIHVSVDSNKTDENNQSTWNVDSIFARLFRRIVK